MTDFDAFRPQAVIFDLDGTLADNMAWHAKAFDAFVLRHGLPPVSMAMRRRIDGKRNSELLPVLFGRDMTGEEVENYEREKEGAYRSLSRGQVKSTPGTARLLDSLAARGIPIAVATSAPAANVAHTLAEIGLEERISIIARSDEVARGKPAPDVYLHAALALGVDPAACLAFEDAPLGVISARTAGMRCIAITSTFPSEVFAAVEPPPDGTYPDFDAYLAGAGRWLLEPERVVS